MAKQWGHGFWRGYDEAKHEEFVYREYMRSFRRSHPVIWVKCCLIGFLRRRGLCKPKRDEGAHF